MRKSRHTLQREIVLQTVRAMQGHVTADMIYERIHAAHPSISRATVYRNLRILEGEGRIMRIEVPDGADYYEAAAREHYHIRCSGCGRLFDAALPWMPELGAGARGGRRIRDSRLQPVVRGPVPGLPEKAGRRAASE